MKPLQALSRWYSTVVGALEKQQLPGVIIANKSDLRERVQVPRAEGERFAQSLGLRFFEASAQSGEGLDAPFQALAAQLLAEAS